MNECGEAKKRIGKQLNYFWNMCPEHFSWAKIKENFFPMGSREDRSLRERHLNVKLNIIILTRVFKKTFGKLLNAPELFTKTCFRTEFFCSPIMDSQQRWLPMVFLFSFFAAKHPDLWIPIA